MIDFSAIFSFSSFVIFLLGLYIFFLNPENKTNRLFLILCITMSLMAYTDSRISVSGSKDEAVFWLRFVAFWPFVLPFFIHFIFSFLQYSKFLNCKFRLLFLYIPPTIYMISSFLKTDYIDSLSKINGIWYYSVKTTMGRVLAIWILLTIILFLISLVSLYKNEKYREEKNKLKLIFVANIIILGGSFFFYFIAPFLHLHFFNISSIIFSFVVFIIAYAVIKYEIYSITPKFAVKEIVAAMSDSLFLIDQNGIIKEINLSAEKMVKLEKKYVVNTLFFDYIEQSDNAVPISQMFQFALAGKSYSNIDCIFTGKDNSRKIPIHLSFNSVVENEKTKAIVCLIHDMSKEEKSKSKISKQNDYNAQRAKVWEQVADSSLSDEQLISNLLGELGQFLNLSRLSFHKLSDDGKNYVSIIDWCNESISSSLGTSIPRWICHKYFGQSHVIFPEGKFPTIIWKVLHPLIKKMKIKGFMALAYGDINDPVGIFTCNTCYKDKYWSKDEIQLLTNFSKIVYSRKVRDDANLKESELKIQLNNAQKMEAVGLLAGGIAHDFNNQLALISTSAELIKNSPNNVERINKYSNQIFDTVKRGSTLTTNLLAYARKGKYRTESVDVNSIIENVFGVLSHSLDKRIVISKKFKDNCFTIGDPSQLHNVFLNIALNSRDAMPDGGELSITTDIVELDIKITDELSFFLEPGNYIKIIISDSGCGIPEKAKAHLFEPFFTTKELGKGTGMGLASVYGTIKNHKGMIEIDSEENHGTIISLFLPLDKPIDVKKEIEDEFLFMEDTKKESTVSYNIMLVEDEEDLREMEITLLEHLGHSVTGFCNGLEAVKGFPNIYSSIDVVLLDMAMPELNGRDTFAKLKEIDPNVKVIIVSGYSIEGEARQILNEGAKGFVQKPFSKKSIMAKITEIIENK